MLKAGHEAQLNARLPEGAELCEPGVNGSIFFTGIKAVVVNGTAHLLCYLEQPSAYRDVEYVVVARLVAAEAQAVASLTDAVMQIAKVPTAIDRPAN
jgi:hypothetical protein